MTLKELHPPERTWRTFIVEEVNVKKIIDFTKDDKLISIGGISASASSFHSALSMKCNETVIESIRSWWNSAAFGGTDKEPEGCVSLMVKAISNAKNALTVAMAAKAFRRQNNKADLFMIASNLLFVVLAEAIHVKIPKSEDQKERKAIVTKTKAYIEKSKVGKARCLWCVCLPCCS